MATEVDYECVTPAELKSMNDEIVELRELVAALTNTLESVERENAELQEDLYCACEAYDSLERIHNEVVAECNELSDRVNILSADLDDMTIEHEAACAELGVCLDKLVEVGELEAWEAAEFKSEEPVH